MSIKKLFNHNLTYLFIGALIPCALTYFFHTRLLERESLNKIKCEKQEFALELSQLLQKRIYNAEVFFWNIRDAAQKNTTLESWDRYKNITIDWNEKLPNNYIKLSLLFPEKKFLVSEYSDFLLYDLSFRDFLYGEIQAEFIPIHGQLVELKKGVNSDQEADQDYLKVLQSRIEKLHIKITNYAEALAKASSE